MPHRVTVTTPLPTGVVGLTIASATGGPGLPAIAGQVLTLEDSQFAKIPNWWFSTANSTGAAILTDNGEVTAGGPQGVQGATGPTGP